MSIKNAPRAQHLVVTNNEKIQKILTDNIGVKAALQTNGEVVSYMQTLIASAGGRPVVFITTTDIRNTDAVAAIKAILPNDHVLALLPQFGASEIASVTRRFLARVAAETHVETLAGPGKPAGAPEAVSATDASDSSISLTSGHASEPNFEGQIEDGEPRRDPIQLTKIQAFSPERITKTFRRGPNGEIIKKSAGDMDDGAAMRIDDAFSIKDVANWWETSGTDNGVLMGISEHDIAHVITKAALEAKPKGAVDKDGLPYIARSRDCFHFPVGRGLFAIDCDEKASIEAFRDELREIAPSLYHAAPSAFRHSASAFIYDTVAGEYVIEEGGIRAFFDVADAQNIAEAGTRLFKWSIIKGHGEAKVSTNGATRVTSPIDKAIYTPEHFIFTAKADCRDGLEARHTKPQVFNADSPPIVLDKAIPHLTADDEAVFEAEVARLKASVADEAAAAREAWLSKRAEADADHEKVKPQHRPAWVKERREFHARALDGKDLFGSFVVTLDDGKNVTVNEILANPSVYDGRLCADPLEPDYDGGRAVGRIRLDGKPTISSFARGGDDGSRFWFLHDYDEDRWRRFADAFAKKKERTQNGDDELGVLSGSDTADAADDQSAPPEDAVPEVDDANEAIIAEMVRRRGVLFTAKVRIGHLTAEEAQANIAEFEAMARSAVYDRVLDGDFPINVELGGNTSKAATVGDIVTSPSEFSGKRVRDPLGIASAWVGKLALERGAPRISMFDKSEPFYLIERPAEGGGRPWSDKSKAAWLEKAKLDDNDRLISNLENVMVALRHAPELEQAFAYDEMNCSVYVMQPLPRVSDGGGVAWMKPTQLTDQHCTQVQEWLQACGMSKIGIDPIRAGIDLRAREEGRAFHPVRDYLDSLKWDGKERISTWLIDYLGAENTGYNQAIGHMFMIAMVARIYKPGCKVDYTLILEGLQGALKSTICKALAGEEWFSDALPDITKDKECSQHIRGKWLIEIAELSSMSKSESNHLKQFLTRQIEKYRPPYGRHEVHEPRQCVFVGTTNDFQYLKDPTGGRRFWPVKVGGNLLHEKLKADRDLLFAEAVAAYKGGETWWPNRDFEEMYMQPEQQGRVDHDAWLEPISDWLAGINPGHRVRLVDIANIALGLDTSKFGRADQNRVKEILRHLGWGRSATRLDGYPLWELAAK